MLRICYLVGTFKSSRTTVKYFLKAVQFKLRIIIKQDLA